MRPSPRAARSGSYPARFLVPMVLVVVAALVVAAIGTRTEPTSAPFTDSVSAPVELRSPDAPGFVPGLVLWLDGADAATRFTDPAGTIPAGVGDRVARWEDKSAVGNDATQLTLASRPTVTGVTGGAVPVFDGGDSLALDPTLLPRGTAPSTVFVVARPDATGTRAAFVHGSNSTGAFRWYGNDGTRIRYVSAFSTANPSTTNWPTGGPGLLTARFADGAATAWAEGGAEVTVAGSFSTGSAYALVGANSGMQYWSGPIHEVLVYDRALSASERRTVEAWLAAKWGIALAPAAPSDLTVTPGVGSVVLGWTAPTDVGGGAVTDYVVQYRAQGATSWTTFADGTSTTASATVTGLAVGTTYEVRVRAVNVVSTGPWSEVASAAAGVAWTPADLPGGLALWLDASDASTFTLESGAVAEWRDRSGNARHVSQATAANRPIRADNVVNGRSVVRWTTGYRALRTTATLSLGDFDVFVAFRDTGVSGYERLVDHDYVNGFWLGRDNTVADSWRSGVREPGSPFGRAVTLADGQWRVVQSRRAGTTHTVRGDGGSGVSGTVSGTPTNTNRIGIGAWADGSTNQFLTNGDIGEVVLVPAALDDADRQRLEGYLAHRWGFASSLPADHPYRGAAPATTAPVSLPTAPTGLTATSPGGGQLTVSWTAPTDGGTPIRDYRVERRLQPSGSWTVVDDGVSTATSVTLSGLATGTHEVRVAAVTAKGTGATSTVSGQPQTPWTPADLPGGLALWLDAADASTFTLDAGAVAEWRDRSGNARHVSQPTAANRPSRVEGAANGQAVVRWTTGYRALRTTQTLSLGDFDVFVAFRDTNVSAYERLVDHDYRNGFWLGRDSTVAGSWRSGVWESSLPHGRAVALPDGSWHVLESRRSGTTHTVRGNGGTGVTGTVPGAATTPQRIGIGGWADGNSTVDLLQGADIGEVVLVPAALDDADRQRLEGYLAHRWGTAASLPAGHPYRATGPATATPATAPAAPVGLTATGGTNQVTLAWTAPADGGTVIRDYRIERRALPSETWSVHDDGVGTATSVTVSGLTVGTTYEFRVAAVNAAGTGATATVTGSPAVYAPGAPTGVTAPAGDGQAVVSWTAPADGGSPITSTTVTAGAGGQPTRTCTAAGTATSCTVTGLVNGATYVLSVAATNAVGTGPSSSAVTTAPVPAVLSAAQDLVVWLDAADPDGDGVPEGTAEHCDTGVTCTAAGNVLTRWVDRSGLGNDAVQATTAMAGRYVPGMANAVNYDANGFNRIAAAPVSPDATTFVVAQSDTANWNTLGWLMGGRSPGGILLHPSGGRSMSAYGMGATYAMIGTVSPADITVPHLYEARVAGTSAVVGHLDVDGARIASDVALGGITRAAGTTTFTLGADDCCGLRYGDGRYREVLFFDRALTAVERRAVREYLAVKWGLTLAPDRPTGLVATPGNGSIALSWTAPVSTGGSDITDYVVQRRVQGTSAWTTFADGTSTATSALVTGLTNGTAYELRVSAVNAVGTGDATDPVTATPTVPWTPAHVVGGTLLWLDAADASTITLTGGVVSEWRDRSGNARHAAQATAGSRPTSQAAALNGRAVIRFDGTDDHLIAPLSKAQVGATPTIIHVSRPSVSQTTRGLLQIANGPNSGTPFVLQQVSGTTLRHYVNSNYHLTEPITVGTAGISALSYDGSAWRTRRNGTETAAYTGPIGTFEGAATYLGNGYNGYFTGDIAEVVVLATADLATIQRVEGYLAHTWGLAASLPADHPYRSAPPLRTPSAPLSLTATPGGGAIGLSWSAPASSGLTEVTDYVVEYRTSPSGTWTTFADGTGTGTSALVTGLTGGTAYDVRVTAVNGKGAGDPSGVVTATAQTVWTPAALTGGTSLWLDAADPGAFTLSGGAVATWHDRSGNARAATQTAATARPTVLAGGIGGRPAVVFDGVDDHLEITTVRHEVATIAAVAVRTGSAADQYLLDNSNNASDGGGLSLRFRNTSMRWWNRRTTNMVDASGTIAAGSPIVVVGADDAATNRIVIDGQVRGETSRVASTWDDRAVTRIGGSALLGGPFEGRIGEVVIVPRALDLTERQRLEGYLAHRWGTAASLPVGHPYRTVPPGV